MIGRAALAQTAVAAVDGVEPVAGLLRLEEPARGVSVEIAAPNGELLERIGDEAVSMPVYLPVGISGVTLAEDGSGNLSYRLDTGALVSANEILELR